MNSLSIPSVEIPYCWGNFLGNPILSNLNQNCRCMNSWKNKWHDSCNARFTLSFSDQIKELIIENEARSKKECKKRFKLITFQHEALFNPLNYNIICPSCYPSVPCSRHSHLSYCSDTGPKPNPKAKVHIKNWKNSTWDIFQNIRPKSLKTECPWSRKYILIGKLNWKNCSTNFMTSLLRIKWASLNFIAHNSAFIRVIKKHLTLEKIPNQLFRKFKNFNRLRFLALGKF